MSIAEIKAQISNAFIADETVKKVYNLEAGKSFEDQFSTVSIENILFFIVATAMWLNVQLFDRHKLDVLEALKENKAHTPNWYATRAKEFQFGHELVDGTDQYDNSRLTQEQIQLAQIVKFAAAVEADDQSVLFVKVASSDKDIKGPLNDTQIVAFTAYMTKIKDAGVRISVVNSRADDLRLEMDIYYDPLVLDGQGKRMDGADDMPIQNAIRQYISNLPFNGLYTNQSLIDKCQLVDGVEIVELLEASSRYGSQVGYKKINVKDRPYAGYYQISESNLILNFIANE